MVTKAFIVRVELHKPNAEPKNYEELHTAMEEKGFKRTFISKGKRYQLPDAEYIKFGDYTKEEILEEAKQASEKVGKKYSVLVTESNSEGIKWHGLEVVTN